MGGIGADPWAEMTDAIIFGAVNSVLTMIDDVTGLDLLALVSPLESLLGTSTGLFSGLLGWLHPGSGTTTPNVFSGLLAGIGGGGGLTSLTGLFGFLQPTTLTSGAGGVLAPLLSGSTLFGSLIPSLDASKIGSGTFNAGLLQPLIDSLSTGFGGVTGLGFSGLALFFGGKSFLGASDIIHMFPSATSGLTGIPGLSSIFADLTAALGNPTGLGSGSPQVAIPSSSVEGIQGLLDMGNALQHTWNALTTAHGGTTTNYNEVQQLSMGGSPSGGSTRLGFQGVYAALPNTYNDSSTTIQATLQGLSTIGSGNVVCTGGPLGTAPVNVTFQGALANTPLPLILHQDSLTGGPGPQPPALAVNEIQRGGPAVALTDLASAAADSHANAINAFDLATILQNILGQRNNRPVFGAVSTKSEGSHIIANGGRTSVSATSTSSPMAFQTIAADDVKTFLQVVASSTGTITNFYLNIYKFDSSNNLQTVAKSGDLKSQLSGTAGWLTYDLSGSPVSSLAGEVYAFEPVVVGSGTVTLMGQVANDIPVHPTVIPKHPSAVRNPATLGTQPSTISAAAVGYGGHQIFTSFGIGTPPPAFIPPQTTTYLTPGPFSYTIPAFAKIVGAKLDLIGLGGGGAGQGEQGYNLGQGGFAGTWNNTTLTCGVDYPTTATSLTVAVGAGGAQAIVYFADGNPGSATTFTWTDPSSVVHTLTCAGGTGGHSAGFGYNGQGSGNHPYLGTTYPGGADVASGATGSPPGGGGGGAPPFGFGGAGKIGIAYVVARQS